MQDLTLVGLSEDKSTLLLVSDSGAEFTVPADARLRAALRGEHVRLGQLEIHMDSALRPRDIQARIRAGETPETVAVAAQTTVERIMGFATPVLAERAHVAQRAQRSSVRRKAGEGPSRLLADAVAERLSDHDVTLESVDWDAWRRQDGRWKLVADYPAGEGTRHAEFVYDAPGRYVVADNDEARWLVGEQANRKGARPRTGGGPRRLSAVHAEEELPLGADAIDLVSEVHLTPPDTADATDPRDTVDAADMAAAETGDADWIASSPTLTPETRTEDETGVEASPPEPEPEPEPEHGEPHRRPRKSARKNRRPSVPSWDEIMFGGGKQE